MKKIFLHGLYISLIFAFNHFAQADVSTAILMDDGAGGSKILYFGLDSIATDGIDISLDESDLPPFPPPGAFEARYFLPDNNFAGTLGSYKDYRNATLPFTGDKEFRLAYQPGTGTVINITWNFPQTITGVLQDIITGTLINVAMADSGSFTVANPAAFNRLKLLIHYEGITPVELTSFSASVSGSNVILNWQTATELNNSGFEIQRKSENTDWKKVTFINGAGTTTEGRAYSYTDSYSSEGTVYYRLRQVDFDGTSSYSKVLSVDLTTPTSFVLKQNYPNPFNPNTSINFSLAIDSKVSLKIFDVLGQEAATLVNGQMTSGQQTVSFDASSLNSGVYFYRIDASGVDGQKFSSTKKMILTK